MATATLLCKQCNFENEPERVYCHNCGAKLDRALLPPEATKREDPAVVQKRVRAVVQPKRRAGLATVRNLFLSLLVAAALACLFLMSQPPDHLPNLSADAVLAAPQISDDLEDLVQSPSAKRLAYTEDQVNAFLQSSAKTKDESSVKFDRAFVRFEEGLCQTTVQESVFGYALYFSTTDGVQIRNGAIVTHPVSGSIGRLRLSGKIMPYVEKGLAPVWAALDQDRKLVARAGAIAFHPKMVEVTGKTGP